ncbi:MerR family transcriptional regulator [Blautia sp.]|nr:MerR family transcriptional regulator [uncultured Blautia sp.]
MRYYEDAGILPNIERNSSGQRIFTDWHIERLKAICCF